MPHRPEDTASGEKPERPGEQPSEAIEPSHEGPRTTADTQPPPAPGRRPRPGQVPSHGPRRR